MDFKRVGCEGENWIHLTQNVVERQDSNEHDSKFLSREILDQLNDCELKKDTAP